MCSRSDPLAPNLPGCKHTPATQPETHSTSASRCTGRGCPRPGSEPAVCHWPWCAAGEVRGGVPLATSVWLGRTYVFCNLSTGGGVGPCVTGRGWPGLPPPRALRPHRAPGTLTDPSPPPPTRERFSLREHTAGATFNPGGGRGGVRPLSQHATISHSPVTGEVPHAAAAVTHRPVCGLSALPAFKATRNVVPDTDEAFQGAFLGHSA